MSDPHVDGRRIETRLVHAGWTADPQTGAVSPPIHPSSTFKQDGVGGLRGGYEYSRTANPTRRALEEAVATLEGASRGLAFASGMAASDAVLRTLCAPGGHVVIPDDAYGGTYRLVARVLERWGVEHTAVALRDVDAVRAAVQPGRTTVVWVETPTNPLLNIADIAALAGVAHEHDATLVVDNTFASPYLQQPVALGADVVVHSATKYLGGHSDVVGGVVAVAEPRLGEEIAFHQNAMGAIAGPFDAWLVLRGIRTLGVRMDRHCANAAAVAAFLERHPAVSRVLYPGLVSHPDHDLASRQMTGFGGMVSFQVAAGVDAALAVCERAQLFTLAESLGGVESLIEHPARMTHASVAGSALEVPDDLVRLSVGIENVDDLIEDLAQALG